MVQVGTLDLIHHRDIILRVVYKKMIALMYLQPTADSSLKMVVEKAGTEWLSFLFLLADLSGLL